MAEREIAERLAKLEGVVSELSKRIDDLNHSLSGKTDLTNKRIDDLRSEIRLWFVIITLTISLVTILTRLTP
ncbi:MAG: hypothetical protein AOA65_2229 [Candidatus Bathyarchaeota archaeon BA1]|nr:MAG: hypothetical protein AOA65_2229 [Candidatus Bathyarchaeota archaeon BA1]